MSEFKVGDKVNRKAYPGERLEVTDEQAPPGHVRCRGTGWRQAPGILYAEDELELSPPEPESLVEGGRLTTRGILTVIGAIKGTLLAEGVRDGFRVTHREVEGVVGFTVKIVEWEPMGNGMECRCGDEPGTVVVRWESSLVEGAHEEVVFSTEELRVLQKVTMS